MKIITWCDGTWQGIWVFESGDPGLCTGFWHHTGEMQEKAPSLPLSAPRKIRTPACRVANPLIPKDNVHHNINVLKKQKSEFLNAQSFNKKMLSELQTKHLCFKQNSLTVQCRLWSFFQPSRLVRSSQIFFPRVRILLYSLSCSLSLQKGKACLDNFKWLGLSY